MDLIGCCGLNCETCDARIATLTDDDALREKTALLWSKLNNAEITPDMINCVGCREKGVHSPFCENICPIRKCAEVNDHSTCGTCTDARTCGTLKSITEGNPEAIKNLGL